MASPTSSANPSITPTPILFFQNVPQPITCRPLEIAWFYSGPELPITLFATNIGVPQDEPAPSLTSSSISKHLTDNRRSIPTGANNPVLAVTMPIASNVDPLALAYSWPSVNIPQGWYKINATMEAEEYSCVSSVFFVHTGNDTSCIISVVSPSTSSTPIGSPTSPASTAPASVGGASRLNLGAIVGVSVGAVVLVAAVLAAWLCLHRKGRRAGGLGGGASANRWNGLSSVDSRALTSTNPKNYPRRQTHSESVGTIPINASEEAVGAEKNSIYGKSNENYGPFDGPGASLAAMPVLQHQSPRSKTGSRTYSASSLNSNGFSSNEYAAPPGRRPSVPDSGRQSIDSSNTYPPTSPVSPHGGRSPNQFTASNMSRSSHSTSTSTTHQTSTVAQTTPAQSISSHGLMPQQRPAPSPSPQSDPSSDATKQANRNSLGGRKRKPVPAYDPSQGPTSPSSPSSPRPLTTPSPIPPSPSPGPDQANLATNGAHYATRNHAGQDNSLPDLAHKSSFGPGGVEGKPLHYLIPDMPMPLKD